MVLSHGMGKMQQITKRAADIVCALLGILILSPLFLLIAIMLKIQRNGPIIFRQERVGKGGKDFTIYKFRTMTNEIEEEPQLVAPCDNYNSTLLEQFLRSHHLDELPQLCNVLKGDMSIVGPRPERRFFVHQIMEVDTRYKLLYQIKPGLTSEATLYNGYTDTMEKMLRRLDMDLSYLQRHTLWLDFKIAMKTAINIITGKKF